MNMHSKEDIRNNVETVLVDQIVHGLTVQPKEKKIQSEPDSDEIIFTGNFEEVNDHFYFHEWSDGLPIVPPTIQNISKFLQYTVAKPETVVGTLLPDAREATIWNIAVNGVMAGCRPEYMPILVALVEVMADSKFGHEHLGHTPGTEVMITLNGPIISDLGFNYGQGVLRVGNRANTSIGRFWRLYLRNIAGFIPGKADKATFGGTWRVVLAENHEVLEKIGWLPMSADQGFNAGDNVVTVSSCTSTDSIFSVGKESPEEILDKIATRVVDNQLYLFAIVDYLGPSARPQILLSPVVAESLSKAGYSKNRIKEYLFNHARFKVSRYESLRPEYMSLCEATRNGRLPPIYCENTDPDRMVPIVWSPEDFLLTVSGDPDRDNCFLCAQNGFIGYPVSKMITLPDNWDQLKDMK
ncbi:hypothetical protein ACFLWF_00125 [Chloroflexota bacterium]